MALLLGNRNGTVQGPIVNAGFHPLIARDFTNDGTTDLVVSLNGGSGILLGNGDGTFALKTTLPVAPSFSQIAVDWNRDGKFFFFSSRRRHTRLQGDWSSDVCSSD